MLYSDGVNFLECAFNGGSGISKFVSSSFIEGVCVVPLAPAVMTMSGLTFHPSSMMLFMMGWYFWILFAIVSCGNLSLQYVNLIN